MKGTVNAVLKAEEVKEDTKDPVAEVLQEAVKEVADISKEYAVLVPALNVRKAADPTAEVVTVVHSGDILKGKESNGKYTELTEPAGFVATQYIAPKKG